VRGSHLTLLVLVEHQLHEKILPFLMRMLAHPYPRIRRFTAEQIYIKLVEDDSVVPKTNNIDSVMDLLSSVAWDSDDAKKVREERNHVAELLGIELSIKDKISPQQKRNTKVTKDDFQSYASLVHAEGR